MIRSEVKKKAIVLGCKHGGLAAIRALGRLGLPVVAVTDDPREFGLASKYISEIAICPHPSQQSAFVDFLLAHAEEWAGALLLETNDYFATAIASAHDVLAEHYRFITPELAITRLFVEKDLTYALAQEQGVPYPKLFPAERFADAEKALAEIQFPLMIKPVKSHKFVEAFGKKLFIIDSIQALREAFSKIEAAQQSVMLQEIITGTDDGTLESLEIYIDSEGTIRAESFNVKLRQTPPMWGVMRAGKSVPPIEDIRQYSHKLLRAINYRGFASLEFKRDPRDNLPKLIEVNIRMPRNLQMIIASGVNLPWLIYQDKVENIRETIESYTPTYYIDLLPDIGNSLFREPSKLLNLPHFLKPYLSSKKTFAILDFDDPKPFTQQFLQRAQNLGNRLRPI